MSSAPPRREQLLREVDTALNDYRSAVDHDQHKVVDALVEWRSHPLYTVLTRLSHALSDSLSEIPALPETDAVVAQELPDARSRLDYVVQMTEKAAHSTLDGVERCRRQIDSLATLALPEASKPILDGIKGELSEMALAQAYQDLSGQIIRRVINVVQRVEAALTALGVATQGGASADIALAGPVVPQIDRAAISQNDADDLLSGLGL